jgi:(S)-citramalyl-CoA lyase
MATRIRSALFVPASRPERFAKALAAGADTVIIDLEDAVEHNIKDTARRNVREFAQAHPQASLLLRVNDATTPWFADDIAICAELDSVAGVLLPKAESAEQVARAYAAGKPVLPIVESATGVLALGELAASPGVERLSFGSLDLMLQLGTTPDTAGAQLLLDHIRCQILLHSAAQRLASPLDGVYPDFANKDGLAAVARQVRDMGFGGMLCIHPAQIPVIHSVFARADDELDWARRVVATAQDTGSSAFQLDGRMVDAPVIERARRMLEE